MASAPSNHPRFQPWPEASLHSVAKKFLDECDLGDDATRAAVVEFMPFGFAAVNKVGRACSWSGLTVYLYCIAAGGVGRLFVSQPHLCRCKTACRLPRRSMTLRGATTTRHPR